MTIRNRKKNPLKPDELVGKFPAKSELSALQKNDCIYLVTARDKYNQINEAWWVDYTNIKPPFSDPHPPFVMEA